MTTSLFSNFGGLLVFCLLFLAYAHPFVTADVGSLLDRTFGVFTPQPLSSADAEAQGWSTYLGGTCDPALGIAYAQTSDNSGPNINSPLTLYYTSAGQLSGYGVRIYGPAPSALVPDFWVPASDDEQALDLNIIFRNSSIICSGVVDNQNPVLGDQVSINNQFNIPLNSDDATNAGWVMGDCIPKMGIHYAYDLNAPGTQTWNTSSLVPTLPMYNPENGYINAVLVSIPDLQIFKPLGEWEGPFLVPVFCGNWCHNSGCQFPGAAVFSTMHLMFRDPSLNDCTGAPCKLIP